MTNDYVIKSLM